MSTPSERLRVYRLRAQEIRTAAADVREGVNRATLLRIARDYDLMADSLEAKVS